MLRTEQEQFKRIEEGLTLLIETHEKLLIEYKKLKIENQMLQQKIMDLTVKASLNQQ